jgi:periplasmic copper chaperone A
MSNTTCPTTPRRLGRLGLGLGAAVVLTIALPGVAQAHVTVQPGSTEGGGFSVIAFRVPNERDDASTTRLRVVLPEGQPIGSVQTTPVPGWTIATKTRQLDEPIDMFGEQVDTVVSEVVWKATDGGVEPGQFQDFDLSLGPLPESGELVFNAQQTYSSGEVVKWDQVSVDESVEPERPAPTLALAPPAAAAEDTAAAPAGGTAADSGDAGDAAQSDQSAEASESAQAAAPAADEDDSSSNLALGLAVAALVISLIAVALAYRRGGRKPAAPTEDAAPTREDVKA